MATAPQPVPQGPPASIPIQLTFDYGNLLNDNNEVVRPFTCTDIFDEDLCKTLAELQENATGLTKEINEYVKANEAEIERLTKLVNASTSAEVTQRLKATINKLQAENSSLKGVVASTNTYVGGIRTELSKKRKLGSVAVASSDAGDMEDVSLTSSKGQTLSDTVKRLVRRQLNTSSIQLTRLPTDQQKQKLKADFNAYVDTLLENSKPRLSEKELQDLTQYINELKYK